MSEKLPLTVEELVDKWEAKQELELYDLFPFQQVSFNLDLVSVTPMEAPIGITHYLNYVFSDNS
jgi:hypothetical protein